MSRTSRLLGPVVAALVVAATGLLALPVATAPATAAGSCSGTSGVIVVVDFNELGGGLTRGCDATDGHTAAQNFGAAGYDLSYSHAPGMNGYVCTVQGKPTDGDCTGTTAYWSLWWADGKGGAWTYASLGADSLKVPAGGYVAFAWHQGSGKASPPGVIPSKRAVATPPPSHPTTSGAGTGHSSRHPQAHPTAATSAPVTSSVSASPSASGSTTPSAGSAVRHRHARDRTHTPSPSASDSSSTALPTIDEVSAGPPPTAPAADGGSGRTWLAVVAGVVVIGAAAAVPLLRRRRAG